VRPGLFCFERRLSVHAVPGCSGPGRREPTHCFVVRQIDPKDSRTFSTSSPTITRVSIPSEARHRRDSWAYDSTDSGGADYQQTVWKLWKEIVLSTLIAEWPCCFKNNNLSSVSWPCIGQKLFYSNYCVVAPEGSLSRRRNVGDAFPRRMWRATMIVMMSALPGLFC
jgi:hypothetical protein